MSNLDNELALELALAAADASDIADRLSERERAELVRKWTRLTDAVGAQVSDGAAVLTVRDWRRTLRARYRVFRGRRS